MSNTSTSDDKSLTLKDPTTKLFHDIVPLLTSTIYREFKVNLKDCIKYTSQIENEGRVAFQVYPLVKPVKSLQPNESVESIATRLANALNDTRSPLLLRVESERQFVNMFLSTSALSSIVPSILSGDYVKPRIAGVNADQGSGIDGSTLKSQERVMIEYSQPNTHKVFHIGHLRNAALGDSLVRIYRAIGYPTLAVNYFGDEGTHIAKCLWQLLKYLRATKLDLDNLNTSVPPGERAEWLGNFYTRAVEQLELGSLTRFPFEHIIAAKVIAKQSLASDESLYAVKLQITADDDAAIHVTVVCGGHGYNVGDMVAYMPVGASTRSSRVEIKIIKGVASHGIIMSEKELGLDAKSANKIFVMSPNGNVPIGMSLIEIGRLPDAEIADGRTVIQELAARNKEVDDILLQMEIGHARHSNTGSINSSSIDIKNSSSVDVKSDTIGNSINIYQLWQTTREWSIVEFKKIYKWLDCHFDHDFYESQVGEESKTLVREQAKKGVLQTLPGGAIAANLEKYKLGTPVLLKSNGTGLYATKDLELARRKFEEFHIDRNIYIVDIAQSLHFKQVFQCLQLFGFKNANKCQHLAYGRVVLPSGKMSSRKGTVIPFSTLVKMLTDQIQREFLSQHHTNDRDVNEKEWTSEELQNACRAISVATIKFGMLNHDVAKDIVFELKDWTARSGMTGPYMMYAYARCQSILRDVKPHPDAKIDYNLLTMPTERSVLSLMHRFWFVVSNCLAKHNPSGLCEYVYDLAKAYSVWYTAVSVKHEINIHIQATRLCFVEAFSILLKQGLYLLGITTISRM